MKKILSIILAAAATLALATGCNNTNVTIPSVTVPSDIESLVSEGKEIVDELNVAMQHIKDGNFDYMLPTDIKEKGEIGAMYRNYEDMRLRLKESADEKIEREPVEE